MHIDRETRIRRTLVSLLLGAIALILGVEDDPASGRGGCEQNPAHQSTVGSPSGGWTRAHRDDPSTPVKDPRPVDNHRG